MSIVQKTALHRAVEVENSVLVAMLLGKGADITQRDSHGLTPVHKALEVHIMINMFDINYNSTGRSKTKKFYTF
jgi:hypothetical protein